MDLSKLSNEDLIALNSGDLSKLSNDGLKNLHAQSTPVTAEPVHSGLGDKILSGLQAVGNGIVEGGSAYLKQQRDLGAGAIRGAGSIGATIVSPYDITQDYMNGKGLSLESNRQRRASIDDELQELLGADQSSMAYKVGKIGTEIAGTGDIGGVLGGAVAATGKLAKLATALKTSGLATSAVPAVSNLSRSAAANAITRVGAGATTGAASAGLIDPDSASSGAMLGGVLPAVGKVANAAGSFVNTRLDNAGRSLMQSALKPTLKQRESGDGARAIQTLLDEGLNATKDGVEQLQSRVYGLNDKIKSIISGSDKTINKQSVIDSLSDVRNKFRTQVTTKSDLAAIDNAADDFASHPDMVNNSLTVQQAQAMKQGTYKTIEGKFGETGSANVEAQKGLAKGLKEQIAILHPEVVPLNAREGQLINALKVTERRALLDENKNPIGIAGLAAKPIATVGMMADRSALVKSLLARGSNSLAKYSSSNADLAKALLQNATRATTGVMSQ